MTTFAEVEDLHSHDTFMAMAIASAFTKLVADENVGVAGAALGLALGEWVSRISKDPVRQEKALDAVLRVAAKVVKDIEQ